jgi:putative spermidine/putrescine transport system ATP-binding protein
MTEGPAPAVSAALPALSLRRLRKAFGTTVAVDGVSLDAAPGEFLSLLGPSGCGKSTVLRMVAGLVEPDEGQIVLAGEDITRIPVHRRHLGLVFQSYALFPHMTVFENVAFGLRRRRVDEGELCSRVERMLDLVRLGRLGGRHPRELSGGQQQRVALARALVTEPRVLLLDEPLSNLDALLRDEMRVELKRLQERLGTTMIFVTHDQAEALTLSDRVVVMESGRVEQIGRPEEVYRRPATPFVARFMGRANFFPGIVAERDARGVLVALEGGLSVRACARDDIDVGQRVQMAIRQESIRLAPASVPATSTPNRFPATVVFHAFAGQAHHYVLQLADGRELEVATPGTEAPLARGVKTTVEWAPEDIILLLEGEPRAGGTP